MPLNDTCSVVDTNKYRAHNSGHQECSRDDFSIKNSSKQAELLGLSAHWILPARILKNTVL